ncbi:MAG: hypothetical protein QGH99_06845 [Pseudomonadales bacterium]|nr:hypothetical protein [Pseudomonadales bacterium]MDP6317577.1 hypothetical protein [Pseudomonadales bacterium]MDP7316325.1 hypothetical protein [Pseudomonadales bacterium]MDP7576665.1 hypothetical protein [Pseudomonadales bacterium]HJP50531.1 hypothetical protein [Pseudomonadales bacterium]
MNDSWQISAFNLLKNLVGLLFGNMLDEEVETITWLLATMSDLHAAPGYEGVPSAMNSMCTGTTCCYSPLLSSARSSCWIPVRILIQTLSNLQVFALEVLDNLLTAEIKQTVIP